MYTIVGRRHPGSKKPVSEYFNSKNSGPEQKKLEGAGKIMETIQSIPIKNCMAKMPAHAKDLPRLIVAVEKHFAKVCDPDAKAPSHASWKVFSCRLPTLKVPPKSDISCAPLFAIISRGLLHACHARVAHDEKDWRSLVSEMFNRKRIDLAKPWVVTLFHEHNNYVYYVGQVRYRGTTSDSGHPEVSYFIYNDLRDVFRKEESDQQKLSAAPIV